VNSRAGIAVLLALGVALLAVALARVRARRSPRGARFFGHPFAGPGLGILVFFALIALAAPLVAPYDPVKQHDILHLANQPPSWQHVLGTDALSRDVWSRIVYGSRLSLSIGALAALLAVSAGAAIGAVAGYYRRWVDGVLMRLVDVGLAFPRILLLIMVAGLWGQLTVPALIVLIGLTGWFATSRLVRAEVLTVRERAFIDAARAAGAGPARVVWRHVLPNVTGPIIVSAALGVGNVVLLEAGISFLGFGVQPPRPSWGRMIADGTEWLASAPWASLWPGLAIAVVVMSLNAVGDALRDALDPRREAA
jgi:ABC-type dipeptide/oligopeptide/nickel transport system permease subunit